MNVKMNVMDLQADIKWIKKELNQVSDPNLIEAFKNLLKYRKTKVENYPPMTIEQYNKDLEEAEARIEKGEFYTHEEVEKIARQW